MTNKSELSPFASSLNELIEACAQSQELWQRLARENTRSAITEADQIIENRHIQITPDDSLLNDI